MAELKEEEIKKIATSRNYVLELNWPIQIGNMEPINSLNLTRFNVKQMKIIDKVNSDFDKTTKMIELSSGESEMEIDSLDVTDFTKAAEICQVFMDASHL